MMSAFQFTALACTLLALTCVVAPASAIRNPGHQACTVDDVGARYFVQSASDITLSFFNGCQFCTASHITYNCATIDPDDFQGPLEGAVCTVNNGAPLHYGQFAQVHMTRARDLELLQVVSVSYENCQ